MADPTEAAWRATAPRPGSYTWDLLESPDPEGRLRGVLAWLDAARAWEADPERLAAVADSIREARRRRRARG